MIVFNGRTELLYLVKHVSQYYRNYTTATIEPLYTSLEFLLSKLCPIFLPSHWLLPHIAFDKTVITREEINCKSTLPFSQISTDCQKKKNFVVNGKYWQDWGILFFPLSSLIFVSNTLSDMMIAIFNIISVTTVTSAPIHTFWEFLIQLVHIVFFTSY